MIDQHMYIVFHMTTSQARFAETINQQIKTMTKVVQGIQYCTDVTTNYDIVNPIFEVFEWLFSSDVLFLE